MILTVVNFKGGCAKTTSARCISDYLALQGANVLSVDLDSSGNLTQSFGIDIPSKGAGEAIGSEGNADKYIITGQPSLLPSGIKLREYEAMFATQPMSFKKLKKLLSQLSYDYIVVDCPPNLGSLTTMALYACDRFVVPLEPEHFAVNGLAKLLDYAKEVIEEDRFLGAFATRYNEKERGVLRKQLFELAGDRLSGQVFKTVIRRNIALAESQSLGESIYTYSPDSNGAKDYASLTNEILNQI
ncbi:ParA family protein [Tunicatimonas pelagia]|uniref:ParA family protein n=1 Tax=Tunicatimonas pelagia TaxID=931531 RepID=UPI00266717E2|nr:ParA family protein [Tunicatimonas pelagia]WKN46517.1 ParA family protein [Tunicatimonas pelagia]